MNILLRKVRNNGTNKEYNYSRHDVRFGKFIRMELIMETLQERQITIEHLQDFIEHLSLWYCDAYDEEEKQEAEQRIKDVQKVIDYIKELD